MKAIVLALAVCVVGLTIAAPPAEAASKVKSCTNGTYPAPINVRCTFLVGSAFLSVTGVGTSHSPCGNSALNSPCYAGIMTVDLTSSKGAWRLRCSQVAVPASAGGITYMDNSCTKVGTLPPGGTTFAVTCSSWYLTKTKGQGIATLFPGGTGPFGCWVSLSV
jgi:hypothetical protein